MINEPERLLKKPEAAARLGVSVSSLDRLLRSGALEKVKVRGRVLARLSDILRIMAEGATHV